MIKGVHEPTTQVNTFLYTCYYISKSCRTRKNHPSHPFASLHPLSPILDILFYSHSNNTIDVELISNQYLVPIYITNSSPHPSFPPVESKYIKKQLEDLLRLPFTMNTNLSIHPLTHPSILSSIPGDHN